MKTETLEGNKLIAEFDGWTETKPHYGICKNLRGNRCDASIDSWEDLQYHISWEWLMPVVQKIIGIGKIHRKSTPVTDLTLETPINDVWEKCIQFIQWYNLTEH
jgi:hypothetical protein